MNAQPIVGPVLISEINYHPAAGAAEFVEIGNAGGTLAVLEGWKLEGAGGFTFPAGTTLAAGALLVVADVPDADAFRAAHSIPATVAIFAHAFDLGDAGESVELLKPNTDPLRPMIRVERVRFNDKAPWPAAAAGLGSTLERTSCTAYANDPVSWLAGGTPGTWGCTIANPDSDNDGLPDAWESANGLNPADPADAIRDPDGDGMDNTFEFTAGTDPQSGASVLRLRAAGYSAAGQALRLPSVAGKSYLIEYSENLLTWQTLAPLLSGTGGELEVIDPGFIDRSHRYYRASVMR
jgi:hypothetical protein